MNFITSVTSRGQITIPAPLRKAINLTVGEQVVISHTNKSLTVQPLPKNETIMALFGSVNPIEQSTSPDEAIIKAKKNKAVKTVNQMYE